MGVVSMLYAIIKYLHFDIEKHVDSDFPELIKDEICINGNAEVDGEELYDRLSQLIGENKGDGFYIRVTQSDRDLFVTITLNVYEGFHENPDYSYIIAYLKSLQIKNEDTINDEENKENKDRINYLISLSIDQNDFINLKDILKNYGIDLVQINHTIHRTEQGAGGWWESFLLGIVTNLSTDALKKVLNKVNVLEFEIGEFDRQRLLENVASITDSSVIALKILDFEEMENKIYKVLIINNNQEYRVKCNKQGKILSLKTKLNTVTKI